MPAKVETIPIKDQNMDKTSQLRPVHNTSQKLSDWGVLRVCPCPLNMGIEEGLSNYAGPFINKA
jgi:hypothetical protein